MTWDKGFDCRGSSGFVTDPTDHTYVLPADIYPVTRISATFGLIASAYGSLDGNAGFDPRIAGCVFVGLGDGGAFDLRVDLPAAGDYLIRLGIGKHNENPGIQIHTLYDNTTSLWGVSGTPLLGEFMDANGNIYSAANWPGSNTTRLATFATTTLKLHCTTDGTGSKGVLAHLFISQVVEEPAPLSEDYGQWPMHIPGARRTVTVFC